MIYIRFTCYDFFLITFFINNFAQILSESYRVLDHNNKVYILHIENLSYLQQTDLKQTQYWLHCTVQFQYCT